MSATASHAVSWGSPCPLASTVPSRGVVLETEHTCMTLRGVRATGSVTVTSAMHGLLRDDGRSREEFLALAGIRR